MLRRSNHGPVLWWFAGVVLLIAGCVGREVVGHLPCPVPEDFSESGQSLVQDRWWFEFADPALNDQMNQAFAGNFELAAALDRLRAARAVARRQASDLFPDVNGVNTIETFFNPGPNSTTHVWGLDAAYQVDIWGQIRYRVYAERLRASATREDYLATALTLSAEIARTWYSLVEARAQLELLDEQYETNETGLELQEARFGQGLIRSPDVLRQRQLVESTLEQIAVVTGQIEVLEHELAVLLGQMPQSAKFETGAVLPELPPLPATGLPSELLQRRPDVRRDWLAFAAADRDLAAAITDQYPRISLTGSVLNVANHPETVFQDWFVSIGGQIVAPLIDGGQREAEVYRTGAVVRERFNQYGQTMLIAFQEVEDALAREKYQLERLEHLEAQVELAKQSSAQLREEYLTAEGEYLDVLTAVTAQQRLQRETLSARLDLILIRIGLYLALAGGFEPTAQNMPLQNFQVELSPEIVLDE